MQLPSTLCRGAVVLITGGGTGLGLAAAKRFAQCGAAVIAITGRRVEVLQKVAVEIEIEQASTSSTDKVLVLPIGMDVRNLDSVKAGLDKIAEKTNGRLPTIVINNAAGNFISPTENLSANAWRAVIDIVLMGTINVTTEVGKRWIERRKTDNVKPDGSGLVKAPDQIPQVVFMSVGASYVVKGQPFLAPSATAKTGVNTFMNSLAHEWGKYNMRFFMVCPGPIYTEGAFARLDPTGQWMSEGKVDQIVPLGRSGTQEEYSNFIVFCCSPMCSWLSGTTIHLDGASMIAGGEFDGLNQVTPDQWKHMETLIRKTNEKSKAQRAKL